VAYLLLFAGYTVALQNLVLLALSLIGFGMVHAMILREEKYLTRTHGDTYLHYRQRVPRYLLL
jgi:protein-S-isoprenylcysteine O-methyltransferase Ste14